MKRYLLAFALLLGSRVQAQDAPWQFSPLPLETTTHRVVYAADRSAPEATPAELLARARTWPAASTDYRAGSPQVDTAAGTLSRRVIARRGEAQYAGRLTVRVRHGAYHYRLTDLTYTRPTYARAGKHSTGPVTTAVETLVYTRPSAARTRRLMALNGLFEELLRHFEQAMQLPPADLVSTETLP
ncbi:hypothetical protein KLP40_08605 [Hymenobacter sp. NST-14]|uniref:hypothetical protein n=1 Tax=Hymenobacter piscis TaxID=2839984 RepID=UPI001C017DFD|nr:hypothetical protein [Hymenobacter piscis]MBT9393222.1 hypothetical protein [Hymenobacter piscis]